MPTLAKRLDALEAALATTVSDVLAGVEALQLAVDAASGGSVEQARTQHPGADSASPPASTTPAAAAPQCPPLMAFPHACTPQPHMAPMFPTQGCVPPAMAWPGYAGQSMGWPGHGGWVWAPTLGAQPQYAPQACYPGLPAYGYGAMAPPGAAEASCSEVEPAPASSHPELPLRATTSLAAPWANSRALQRSRETPGPGAYEPTAIRAISFNARFTPDPENPGYGRFAPPPLAPVRRKVAAAAPGSGASSRRSGHHRGMLQTSTSAAKPSHLAVRR